jgi:hypothetical protein
VEAACGMRSRSATVPLRLRRRSLWPLDVGSLCVLEGLRIYIMYDKVTHSLL